MRLVNAKIRLKNPRKPDLAPSVFPSILEYSLNLKKLIKKMLPWPMEVKSWFPNVDHIELKFKNRIGFYCQKL
jgi:hypothetical protein